MALLSFFFFVCTFVFTIFFLFCIVFLCPSVSVCACVCRSVVVCACLHLSGVKIACKFSGVKHASAMKVNAWTCTCATDSDLESGVE